jgi:ATP-dependent RNA helicase DDX3X
MSARINEPIDPTNVTSGLEIHTILYESSKSPSLKRNLPSTTMEAYDEVRDALRDITNDNNDDFVTVDDDAQSPDGIDKSSIGPREAGWTAPVPFSYESYNDKNFNDWDGMAPRYEWKDEYGDIGPRNEELEKQLFNDEYMPRAGLRFDE